MGKILLKSLVTGIVITILCIVLVFLTENRVLARTLFFPATVIKSLMGPGPLLGYDQNGQPMYEGTPLDLFIVIFGVLLCVPFYSLLSSVFFLISAHFRKSRLENAGL